MLVSVIQRSHSAIWIHLSPPSWTALHSSHSTPGGRHRAPSWAPWAPQQVLPSYILHTWLEPWISISFLNNWASLVDQTVKNPPALQDTWVWSPSQEDPLEEEIVTDSNTLAWRTPWTEEPGGLQSMVSQSQAWLRDFHSHRTVLNSPKSFSHRLLSGLLNVSNT